MSERTYQWYDSLFIGLDRLLRARNHTQTARPSPAAACPSDPLTPAERTLSGRLMRVNHTGELCAQALYWGQSLTARTPEQRALLYQAAQEESDHLHWCQERLQTLKSHPSFLNPIWWTSSWCLGVFSGLWGDRWSLGFLAETEKQVCEHLALHLTKLPLHDYASKILLKQMLEEEAQHCATAEHYGGYTLPFSIRLSMRGAAKLMTYTTYWV